MVRPPLLYLIEHRNCEPGAAVTFRDDTIYVMSKDHVPQMVVLKCPNKECGEVLSVSVDPRNRPHWALTLHSDKSISLHPPVKHTCGVRFTVTYGAVQFRDEPPAPS